MAVRWAHPGREPFAVFEDGAIGATVPMRAEGEAAGPFAGCILREVRGRGARSVLITARIPRRRMRAARRRGSGRISPSLKPL